MKHRLRDLLACPSCGAFPLDLTVIEVDPGPQPPLTGRKCGFFCSWDSTFVGESATAEKPCSRCYGLEITQGILHCEACQDEFPVVDGIPRFNPDARTDHPDFFRRYQDWFRYRRTADVDSFRELHAETKRSFGFQWLRYRVTDHAENQAHFFRRTETSPAVLAGKLFFEAGCGMGRYLKVIADEPAAEAVGLDLSPAVERAYAENRRSPFIHVVQGDVLKLPFRPQTFDHVYSIGVLHHTPSTKRAFHCILQLAKPGGRVSVWVYHVWRPPQLKGLRALHASVKGRIGDTLRILTTRLPHRVLHYLCYLAVPIGGVQRRLDGAPAAIRALFTPLLLIPCSNHARWEVRLLDTFDWYSPRYQWKHTVPEVEQWFREAGLVDISTAGFPVSVRGTRPASRGSAASRGTDP